jgi:hypothetical protein
LQRAADCQRCSRRPSERFRRSALRRFDLPRASQIGSHHGASHCPLGGDCSADRLDPPRRHLGAARGQRGDDRGQRRQLGAAEGARHRSSGGGTRRRPRPRTRCEDRRGARTAGRAAAPRKRRQRPRSRPRRHPAHRLRAGRGRVRGRHRRASVSIIVSRRWLLGLGGAAATACFVLLLAGLLV